MRYDSVNFAITQYRTIAKRCKLARFRDIRYSNVPSQSEYPPSHLPNTSRRAASAAELAVKKKVNKYAHLLDNYIFVPFAVETFGPCSHDAKVLVSQIGQILISITGDRRCTTYLRQRLSIAIQRGNAMSVLGTLPESSPLDELFVL
ncbi:hypothetical protein ANN_16448 [Periplaneta americana]|uniref:Uncharacterized protein n=1 Tax=Periplaneta americana TaxID=6978 RepID=A0ABQ8SJ00_PERAM|nr:hypothetical protein ANN_16448 [Periplaneta americana]